MPAHAITRGISSSFAQALVAHTPSVPIDVAEARKQHAAYVQALRALGYAVVVLPALDAFPDACFVEDCAVVHGGTALLTRTGAPSRRGEGESLRAALVEHGVTGVETMEEPATLEGGDCLRIGRRLFVGLGARTNEVGVQAARTTFGPLGLEVVGVPIGDVLHLKCVCSSPGPRHVLVVEGTVSPETFAGVEPIIVPREEAHASNCVELDGNVLIPAGCPTTQRALEAAGYRVSTIDNEQIRRADGALTCLSIRLTG